MLSMTPIEFLAARILQEEEAARACPDWPWRLATMEDENREDVFAGDTVLAANGELVLEPSALPSSQQYAIARHVATWDPARALDECRAKRDQIEQLRELGMECSDLVKVMASVWSHHADYDHEWRLVSDAP